MWVPSWPWLWKLVGKVADPPKPKAMPAPPLTAPDTFKGMTFEGSIFPYDPYTIFPVKLNQYMKDEYLPALKKALPNATKGLQLLITAMAHVEGFYPGSRSYKTKNPGNIGNTDSGSNVQIKTLEEGIKRQEAYINRIVEGKNKAYPMGKAVHIPHDFSPEIDKNRKTYQAKNGYIPGYKFVFTGQLDQFVKIYATLPRINNNYIDTIVSYFKQNGLEIQPDSRLGDIIQMK